MGGVVSAGNLFDRIWFVKMFEGKLFLLLFDFFYIIERNYMRTNL
jgi:hypothetical protein